MMKLIVVFLLLLNSVSLADKLNSQAAEQQSSGQSLLAPMAKNQSKVMSQMAIYQEEEQGIEKPYLTRIIVNPQFLRIDEGRNNSSFVLYDRSDKIVYSVVHENQSIMIITRNSVQGRLSKEIKHNSVTKQDKNLPRIGGNSVVQLIQSANNQECHNYMLVPNVLPKLVSAFQEYRSVLAGQHWINLAKTPKEMQDPCFTVYDIYKHSAHLKYGLVVRAWNKKKRKQLVDYKKDIPVNSALFVLPKSYARYKSSGR